MRKTTNISHEKIKKGEKRKFSENDQNCSNTEQASTSTPSKKHKSDSRKEHKRRPSVHESALKLVSRSDDQRTDLSCKQSVKEDKTSKHGLRTIEEKDKNSQVILLQFPKYNNQCNIMS